MITCYILHDKEVIHQLACLISKFPLTRLLGLSGDYYPAVKEILRYKPQVIFIDILILKTYEIELSMLRQSSVLIVISKVKQHAYDSYEYGGFDFMLTPICYQRFANSMHRYLTLKHTVQAYDKEPPSLSMSKNERALIFKYVFENNTSSCGIISLNTSEILYIESVGNYINIYLKTSHSYRGHYTLKHMIELLPDRFIRVHKSYIIRLDLVNNVTSVIGKYNYTEIGK